jgi:hypothetical protein
MRIRRHVSLADAPLLLQALTYCVAVRIALWTVPSPRLLRYVRRRVDGAAEGARRSKTDGFRIAWAARAAGRRVPRATCLVQALSAQLLLARHGYGSELRVGVKRDNGEFQAHAWVEFRGSIVVGADGHSSFTPLPDLGSLPR